MAPITANHLFQWADSQQKACIDGLDWIRGRDLPTIWASNDRPDFLIWFVRRAALADDSQRTAIAHGAECIARPALGEAVWAEVVQEVRECKKGRMGLAEFAAVGLVRFPQCTAAHRAAFCEMIRATIPGESVKLPSWQIGLNSPEDLGDGSGY